MPKSALVRALLGGVAAAAAVAASLLIDGFSASDVLATIAAFVSGTGLTTVAPKGE